MNTKGWSQVNSSQMQPGDIIWQEYGNMGHIMIYAGDGRCYSAGSTNAIQGAQPEMWGNSIFAGKDRVTIIRNTSVTD